MWLWDASDGRIWDLFCRNNEILYDYQNGQPFIRVFIEVEALGKEKTRMSQPKAPYYYKEVGSDAYHWEKNCSKNQYPAPGWKTSSTPPAGREQCNECKAK